MNVLSSAKLLIIMYKCVEETAASHINYGGEKKAVKWSWFKAAAAAAL